MLKKRKKCLTKNKGYRETKETMRLLTLEKPLPPKNRNHKLKDDYISSGNAILSLIGYWSIRKTHFFLRKIQAFINNRRRSSLSRTDWVKYSCWAEYSRSLFYQRGIARPWIWWGIFRPLFKNQEVSQKIATCLANGPKELMQICKDLEKSQGGLYSQYLDELVKAGFVKRDFVWDLKNGQQRKISRYRLSDNYLLQIAKGLETSQGLGQVKPYQLFWPAE